jgi:hypothetical protein
VLVNYQQSRQNEAFSKRSHQTIQIVSYF